MNTDAVNNTEMPWYKIPWFWIIISPLILVVLACAVTITIAVKNADDVVIGNYYKEGLLINDKKERQRLAANMGLSGKIFFDVELGEVSIVFDIVENPSVLSPTLELFLSHPAREEEDFSVTLHQKISGNKQKKVYFSELPKELVNKWYWSITSNSDVISEEVSPSENWLLKGDVDFEESTISSF
ncbi:MAG: FixH family protein [Cellvibrionaceae bacterium]